MQETRCRAVKRVLSKAGLHSMTTGFTFNFVSKTNRRQFGRRDTCSIAALFDYQSDPKFHSEVQKYKFYLHVNKTEVEIPGSSLK